MKNKLKPFRICHLAQSRGGPSIDIWAIELCAWNLTDWTLNSFKPYLVCPPNLNFEPLQKLWNCPTRNRLNPSLNLEKSNFKPFRPRFVYLTKQQSHLNVIGIFTLSIEVRRKKANTKTSIRFILNDLKLYKKIDTGPWNIVSV